MWMRPLPILSREAAIQNPGVGRMSGMSTILGIPPGRRHLRARGP
jgi:hypothetical protein